MKARLLALVLFIVLLAGGYAYWIFNKPHEDVSKAKVEATYTAEALIQAFIIDAGDLDAALFDKVVELTGAVTGIKQEEDHAIFSFDYGNEYVIQAYLPLEGNDISGLSEGSFVKLKGKYSGYLINDEEFMIPADIKIEKCYLQN